ncbi:hypothetical protein [Chitinibacter tainanensis]|uniref:hypothetical protein n=1 Tax=Chitinibacter tainanensis TaxID=230667 RepID=UPI002357E855|nr:hypothetical protein [Chitinibacter tainanensis]
MKIPEIPLLKCSSTYAYRLIEVSRKFGESRYKFHRRVNWSYRYSSLFYDKEAAFFLKNPRLYMENKIEQSGELEDVFKNKLQFSQVFVVVIKVFAHWLFYIAGLFFFRGHAAESRIYRKAYVDDIELVFDPEQENVLRAVYPFPLNLKRQLRYFKFLFKKGYKFKTDGNQYSPIDLMRFLWCRDLCSLQRMESRAQIRHAFEVAALGFEVIQVSDEFDVGSLDFARAIRRFPIRIINSAHGVGSYLPVHAYHEFHVLTNRQRMYYKSIYECSYKIRCLNTKNHIARPVALDNENSKKRLVFIGQTSSSVTKVVADAELEVMARLATQFSSSEVIELLYKPHPNNHEPIMHKGFKLLRDLEVVNGRSNVIFVSLFSTCYLDPNFVGKKILVRTKLIYPELIFDDLQDIYTLEQLVEYLSENDIGKVAIN